MGLSLNCFELACDQRGVYRDRFLLRDTGLRAGFCSGHGTHLVRLHDWGLGWKFAFDATALIVISVIEPGIWGLESKKTPCLLGLAY
jgi:hypothetical protein